MITLPVCLALLVLAGVNAFFGAPADDWVLGRDSNQYDVPLLFATKGFWRASLVNVTFAAMAMTSGGACAGGGSDFVVYKDRLLALVVNLALCIWVSVRLEATSQAINRKEWWRVARLALMCLLGFGYSVWVAYEPSAASVIAAQQ